jgi:hypothetical protein
MVLCKHIAVALLLVCSAVATVNAETTRKMLQSEQASEL